MDIATIIGIVVGTLLIIFGMVMQRLPGTLMPYLDPPSFAITFGGTLGATLVHMPMPRILAMVPVIKNVFSSQVETPNEVINTLVSFAEKARREGLLTLEDDAHQLDNDFLKKGIQLVVDGTDPDLVKNILEIDLQFLEERHGVGSELFESMGYYSPAFGMIGTLIGLIAMLFFLGGDPKDMSQGMATAILTTLYGAIAANFIFLPIAGKLKIRSGEEVLLRQVMIEGILSIQAGDNPRIVREKLHAFLAPKAREEEAAAGGGGM